MVRPRLLRGCRLAAAPIATTQQTDPPPHPRSRRTQKGRSQRNRSSPQEGGIRKRGGAPAHWRACVASHNSSPVPASTHTVGSLRRTRILHRNRLVLYVYITSLLTGNTRGEPITDPPRVYAAGARARRARGAQRRSASRAAAAPPCMLHSLRGSRRRRRRPSVIRESSSP
eukprot:scaffold376_cov354-Prasinococcus_capsulatus_cf.AAC.5